MIDADAVVLLEGAGLVVPEGVEARPRLAGAEGVGQPEIEEPAIGRPALWLEERVLGPRRRVPRVVGLGDDVVVAGEHQRRLVGEPGFRIGLERGDPGELVGEFLGFDRVAVFLVVFDHDPVGCQVF